MLASSLWLILLGADPTSAQATLVGEVREVLGVGRGRPLLRTEDGKETELRSEDPLLFEELLRLASFRVEVEGGPEQNGAFRVERYRILAVGGGLVPRIGLLARLMAASDQPARLLFVDDQGNAEWLPEGWTKKMGGSVGAKIWIAGGDKAHPARKVGILRPPPKTAEALGKEAAK